MLLLASEWASRLGGEEQVERAAVSEQFGFSSVFKCSRVFILAGANPGELTFKIAPAIGDSSKPHLDPYEDADYQPTSDEDSEEDELEFDSGSEASVSSDEEVVVSE